MKRIVRFAAVFLLLLSSGFINRLYSQVALFSQPYHTPLFLSPSLTGKADHMRLTIMARNQWLNVRSPFNAYGMSYDMRFGPGYHHAIGVSLFNDVQGRNVIQHVEGFVYYAYALDITYDFRLRMGAQVGAIMKATNYDRLVFPDQIGLQPATAEPIVYENRTRFAPDFAVGFSGEIKNWEFGVAMHHIAQPYFSVRRAEYVQIDRKTTLFVNKRFNVYHRYRFKIPLYITPSVVLQHQGSTLFALAGCAVDYRMVHASLWFKESFYLKKSYYPDNKFRTSHSLAASIGYIGKYFDVTYAYEMGFMPVGFLGIDASVHELTVAMKFPYPRRSHIKTPYSKKKRSVFSRSSYRPKPVYKKRKAR